MTTFLIGIGYHEPEPYKLWKSGVIEDYESSTGIFIDAKSEEEAIFWAEEIATILFAKTNPNEEKSWKSFQHDCWIEHDWSNSGWKHCLDFFQMVAINELPNFDNMGTSAYIAWENEKAKISSSTNL